MKEKEIAPEEDERVLAYRRYIIHNIISRPQDMWIMQARRYYLEVKDYIDGSYATGPWLNRMIQLEGDLKRMGKIEEGNNIER